MHLPSNFGPTKNSIDASIARTDGSTVIPPPSVSLLLCVRRRHPGIIGHIKHKLYRILHHVTRELFSAADFHQIIDQNSPFSINTKDSLSMTWNILSTQIQRSASQSSIVTLAPVLHDLCLFASKDWDGDITTFSGVRPRKPPRLSSVV
jgi:hypothetical protein